MSTCLGGTGKEEEFAIARVDGTPSGVLALLLIGTVPSGSDQVFSSLAPPKHLSLSCGLTLRYQVLFVDPFTNAKSATNGLTVTLGV